MEEMMIDDYVVSAAQALMAATVCAVVASRVSRERRVRGIESIESIIITRPRRRPVSRVSQYERFGSLLHHVKMNFTVDD
jgi:hypothetical protein